MDIAVKMEKEMLEWNVSTSRAGSRYNVEVIRRVPVNSQHVIMTRRGRGFSKLKKFWGT